MNLKNITVIIKDGLKANSIGQDSLIMVISAFLANIFVYIYQLSMGILLEPPEYGILLSLTALLIIISMFGDTITLIMSRLTSKYKAEARLAAINYVWYRSLKYTFIIGVLVFAIAAGLSPLISRFLKINNIGYLLITFSSWIFAFSLSGNWGVMQGLQRFLSFGLNRVLWALLRPAFAIILVSLGFGLIGGLAALPISYAVALIITFLLLLRNLSHAGKERVNLDKTYSYAGLTLLAIFSITMLVNIDVVLAKHFLTPIDAGRYSAVSVLGRISFYAPMGIALAMFPKTSESFEISGRHHRLFITSVLLAILIVGTICLAYALFPRPIVDLIFSDKYLIIAPYIFKYSLGMSFLSLSYLAMTYLLSIGRSRVAFILLAAMLSQLGMIGLFHSDITQFVNIMFISGILSLVLVLLFLSKNSIMRLINKG